ncbi:MAG: hypothetical protein HN337_04295 [Deltaproteobacteria bacterium]|nr:hypothetical protein [Deltaproteobacteria bacterium]
MKFLKLTVVVFALLTIIGCGANRTIETNTTDSIPDIVDGVQTIEENNYVIVVNNNLEGVITKRDESGNTIGEAGIVILPDADGFFDLTVEFPDGSTVDVSGHVDEEGIISYIEVNDSDSSESGNSKSKSTPVKFDKVVSSDDNTYCGLSEENECWCWTADEDDEGDQDYGWYRKVYDKMEKVEGEVIDIEASTNNIYIAHHSKKLSMVYYRPTSYLENGLKSLYKVEELNIGEDQYTLYKCRRDSTGSQSRCKPDFSDTDDSYDPEVLFNINGRKCYVSSGVDENAPPSDRRDIEAQVTIDVIGCSGE